ncbi:hypothetical protein JW948_12500 [bacterium]|nr:hypothetical protein [bacterium]
MKKKTTAKKQSKTTVRKASKQGGKKRGIGRVFLWIFIIIVLLVAGGVFYVLNNLNYLVKSAIEKYGSEAVQTAVRVQRVDISLKEGSAAIAGLTVANPKGYQMKHAFSLGETGADIDLKSVTETVKVIEKIVVDAPEIFVEVNADNKMNLNDIRENLAGNAPAKKETATKKAGKKGEDPLLRIRYLRFSEARIVAKVIPLDKEYNLKMSSFVMRDLGGANGAPPDKIARQVLKELTSRAIAEVRKNSIGPGVSKLKEEAGSKLKKEADSKLKGIIKK